MKFPLRQRVPGIAVWFVLKPDPTLANSSGTFGWSGNHFPPISPCHFYQHNSVSRSPGAARLTASTKVLLVLLLIVVQSPVPKYAVSWLGSGVCWCGRVSPRACPGPQRGPPALCRRGWAVCRVCCGLACLCCSATTQSPVPSRAQNPPSWSGGSGAGNVAACGARPAFPSPHRPGRAGPGWALSRGLCWHDLPLSVPGSHCPGLAPEPSRQAEQCSCHGPGASPALPSKPGAGARRMAPGHSAPRGWQCPHSPSSSLPGRNRNVSMFVSSE